MMNGEALHCTHEAGHFGDHGVNFGTFVVTGPSAAAADLASLRSEVAALTARAEKAEAEAEERLKMVETLDRVIDRGTACAHDSRERLNAAEATISRLSEALDFYAAPESYLPHGYDLPSIVIDGGDIARAALSTPETPAAPAEETKP